MSRRRNQLGRLGEEVAAQYLLQRGYSLVQRRWRRPTGEIDLIMRQGDTLVFIEVRSRAAPLDQAAESVGPQKRCRLLALAQEYLSTLEAPHSARIDVICVSWRADGSYRIEHIEGAIEVSFSP